MPKAASQKMGLDKFTNWLPLQDHRSELRDGVSLEEKQKIYPHNIARMEIVRQLDTQLRRWRLPSF